MPSLSPPLRRGDHWLTLFALSLSAVAYELPQCFAIPALPEIRRVLHASPNSVSWVLTAFLIAASVATPILGASRGLVRQGTGAPRSHRDPGDRTARLGGRGFEAVLIGGRVWQGVSGGFFPLGFAIVRDVFPPAKVAGALGLVSSLLGTGSAAGLVLAGPVVTALGYRWLFWIAQRLASGLSRN